MYEFTRRDVLAASAALQTAPAVKAQRSTAPPQRRLLSSAWPAEKLARTLLPPNEWHPYPRAAERAGLSSPTSRAAAWDDNEALRITFMLKMPVSIHA